MEETNTMRTVCEREVTLAAPPPAAGVNRGFVGVRCAVLGIGLVAHWTMCRGFDYLLYPFVLFKLGAMVGGVVMLFLCFVTCYGTLRLYDRSKHDWLGIETIKEVREASVKGKSNRLLSWLLHQNTAVVLLLLSIKFDAFTTTAFLRSGPHTYSGLSWRDWKIFLASLLIGNGIWLLASVSIVEFGWKHFLQ